MSRDSGWLVTKSGVWVPVAHNASVSESNGIRRAEFVSLSGSRRVAGRGYEPRSWEVTEDVPWDWAQEIYTAYMVGEGMDPVFFIPPLAAGSNIAPFLRSRPRTAVHDGPGSTSWLSMDGSLVADTGYFPVRPGMKIEFGGYQDGGSLRLWLWTHDLQNGGAVAVDARGMSVLAKRTVTVTNPEARYATLQSWGDNVTAYGGRFARIADLGFGSPKPYGPGGAWVTFDEFEVSHKPLGNKFYPMVTVSMVLTECEMV